MPVRLVVDINITEDLSTRFRLKLMGNDAMAMQKTRVPDPMTFQEKPNQRKAYLRGLLVPAKVVSPALSSGPRSRIETGKKSRRG
jgi:hypothetical protein